MWPEYTVLTVVGIIVVVLIELFVVRSGIFRKPAYWLAMAICLSFQILVDGYLTKLSNPIVLYNPDHMLGLRFPWDIPIEDFGFGFAMLTTVLMVWQGLKNRRERQAQEVTVDVTQ
ncbi:lycopene cyclase domain-containing protein [Yaniella halotolerans]|uniref:lycopene cyclase domain-containing protein n=1 Tax=Yaniella halotolerans TaxID=225453 RepID=UPI0003B3863E|nr:lycopene cyclase domain-containing protein [Yaniella halotolerans]